MFMQRMGIGRYYCSICLSVCMSLVGIISKRLNKLAWFSRQNTSNNKVIRENYLKTTFLRSHISSFDFCAIFVFSVTASAVLLTSFDRRKLW